MMQVMAVPPPTSWISAAEAAQMMRALAEELWATAGERGSSPSQEGGTSAGFAPSEWILRDALSTLDHTLTALGHRIRRVEDSAGLETAFVAPIGDTGPWQVPEELPTNILVVRAVQAIELFAREAEVLTGEGELAQCASPGGPCTVHDLVLEALDVVKDQVAVAVDLCGGPGGKPNTDPPSRKSGTPRI